MFTRHFKLTLLLLCALLVAPMFYFSFEKYTINTDLIVYGAAQSLFSEQLWRGDLYPRWLSEANAGLGSPMFLFYGPLAYYAGSLLAPLSTWDPHGYGRVYLGFFMALMLAGITSLRWLRGHFDEETARRGALIYVAFPYSVLCIYASFGLGHMWAVALLPFVLEGADDVRARGARGLPKLALGYGLLALAHLPSTLVFCWLPLAYVFFLSDAGTRFKHAAFATLAALGGLALSAFYWLPSLANRAFVTSEHFLDGQLVYHENFYHIRFGLGLFMIFLPLVGFFTDLPKGQRLRQPAVARFWLAILAIILFMTTKLSLPLWHALSPLHHLQFPFRFFTAALPGALFLSLLWMKHGKSKGFYQFFGAVCFFTVAFFSFNDNFFDSAEYTKDVHAQRLIIAPEYRTPWTKAAGLENPRSLPENYVAMPPIRLDAGQGSAQLVEKAPRRFVIEADITSAHATLLLKHFYFPGWQASPQTAKISEKDGLLQLELTQGKHRITLSQPEFAGERVGQMISLIAALALLFLWYRNQKRTEHA